MVSSRVENFKLSDWAGSRRKGNTAYNSTLRHARVRVTFVLNVFDSIFVKRASDVRVKLVAGEEGWCRFPCACDLNHCGDVRLECLAICATHMISPDHPTNVRADG